MLAKLQTICTKCSMNEAYCGDQLKLHSLVLSIKCRSTFHSNATYSNQSCDWMLSMNVILRWNMIRLIAFEFIKFYFRQAPIPDRLLTKIHLRYDFHQLCYHILATYIHFNYFMIEAKAWLLLLFTKLEILHIIETVRVFHLSKIPHF